MKNILKRMLIFSIVLLLSISNINAIDVTQTIRVMKTHTNKTVEIYEIKSKEEVIINNGIVDFYETDPNKQQLLDYIAEQERLEQERLAKIALRNELISYAKKFVGNPYVSGGNSLINGTDCSGFVKLIYSKYGYNLPRTTSEQYYSGIGVSINEIEVGDIISYGYNGMVTHSAIYIGDGKIVHAATPVDGIMISNINIIPIMGIRRIII